jgi:hypothetical protein
VSHGVLPFCPCSQGSILRFHQKKRARGRHGLRNVSSSDGTGSLATAKVNLLSSRTRPAAPAGLYSPRLRKSCGAAHRTRLRSRQCGCAVSAHAGNDPSREEFADSLRLTSIFSQGLQGGFHPPSLGATFLGPAGPRPVHRSRKCFEQCPVRHPGRPRTHTDPHPPGRKRPPSGCMRTRLSKRKEGKKAASVAASAQTKQRGNLP